MLRRAPFVLLALAALVPPPAAGQGAPRGCQWLPGTGEVRGVSQGASTINYVRRPRIRCSDGRYIEADSMISFGSSGLHQLFGRVYFQDADQSLRSQRADYFDQIGRLEAQGEVELTDRANGNLLYGQDLLYLRATANRPSDELTMTGGRPRAVLYPDNAADSADAAVPYDVVADRIYLLGDELFRATGRVEVERDSLQAFADSMDYDRASGQIFLERDARVLRGELDLAGGHILLVLPENEIEAITARDSARLVGEEVDLEADRIRIFLSEGRMERLVAVAQAPDSLVPVGREPSDSAPAPPRAVARAQNLVMSADSLEVLAPGEVLDRVIGVGGARAVSSARDSLNTPDTPDIARSDWIEGDTVTAVFAPDSLVLDRPSGEREYRLERLEAVREARSLYRMDPDSASPPPPVATDSVPADSLVAAAGGEVSPRPPFAIHYVEADRILIRLENGAVQHMDVQGLRRGLYLEPQGAARRPRGAAAPRRDR